MKGRWEDWVAIVAGVAAAISWIWTGMLGIGMATLLILGVLTVLAAVISITRPGLIATEAVIFVLGVLMFISPWVLAFTGTMAAAWTAWIAGAVIAVMGLVGMPLANTVHRRAAPR
ncbi:SPW repeat protein [Allosalinactinospora lopnorensis]|uniref:SPW repeat protein n=1 Tax=Allosalinactinospora lopnorensis TaxID=1352348 RepID=UPI001F1DC7F7|nr:SPW repeat protein [Allosalinactinospora lopnorensis]